MGVENIISVLVPASSKNSLTRKITYYAVENMSDLKINEKYVRAAALTEAKKRLKESEGYRNYVYIDTTGNATAGIGHKLTSLEKIKYKKGAIVSASQIEKWFKNDVEIALNAAVEQARDLNKFNPDMIAALTEVNFQLGIFWRTKFPRHWNALRSGNTKQAIKEITTALWAAQTPKRTAAYIAAIERNFA